MKKMLLILVSVTSITCCNILLEKPRILSSSEIEEQTANWETCFTWRYGPGCNVIFTYTQKSAGFLVQGLWVPIRSYNFPYVSVIKEMITPQEHQKDYYFKEPLKIKDPSTARFTCDELCDFLHDKKFIFYTGAGLSASSNVATMSSLMQSLKIDNGMTPFIKEAFWDAQSLAAVFEDFCKSAIEGEPTPGHYAVHEIAQHRNSAIVTENVDLLQQRTGSAPLGVHSDSVHGITPEDFKAVDVMICVGLSHDDCGFIAHYKEQNPNGILIAIDIGMPDYLSSNDYIVQEDLQVILPKMAYQVSLSAIDEGEKS